MLVEKVLGNRKTYPLEGRRVERVFLEWYELDKKLLRKRSDVGEEVGIRLEGHLHEGDVLYADAERILVVDLTPCELTCVPVHTMQEMGRLCFELGNRHLSLSIAESEVRVPYDAPTYEYLEKLGFAPERRTERFSHFTVCHAHGHSHGGEEGHSHGEAAGHGHDAEHSHDGTVQEHGHGGEGHGHSHDEEAGHGHDAGRSHGGEHARDEAYEHGHGGEHAHG